MTNYETFQAVLMYLCLGALACVGIGLFLWKVALPSLDAIRSTIPKSLIQKMMLGVFVVAMVVYGSTKPIPASVFTFEEGLANDGSYTTNSTVHVEWVKTGTPYVPDYAQLYIDYRQKNTTNEWELLRRSTVGTYSVDETLANATNYDFNIWYYYIPPEPVHTNGVWQYKAMKGRNQRPIPIRARIEVNGKAISSPAEKRKDEER